MGRMSRQPGWSPQCGRAGGATVLGSGGSTIGVGVDVGIAVAVPVGLEVYALYNGALTLERRRSRSPPDTRWSVYHSPVAYASQLLRAAAISARCSSAQAARTRIGPLRLRPSGVK